MTTSIQVPAVPWGDRTELLPKNMLYALSLDIEAESSGSFLTIVASKTRALRHLLDETVVTMPEGLRCDVPIGTVAGGQGEIGSAADPWSPDLQMRLRMSLGDAGPMNVEIVGVVSFNGGPESFTNRTQDSLSGTTFIASRHEALSATYRWLNRRQLYGVGKVKGKWLSGGWRLEFTYDLYAAA